MNYRKQYFSIMMSASLLAFISPAMADVQKTCKAKAIENVEAVSRIMYAPKGLNQSKTALLASNPNKLTYEIETFDASKEPLHCIYMVQMESNILGDCWLNSLLQTECSQ